MSFIKKLDESVIRLISAGEIIHRPINAIKELIENSIDAAATKIVLSVYENGLKSICIFDNGIGISVEDFPMVCERFSTSKLESFKDLGTIGTYGFRGEALASISSVSRISLTSKRAGSDLAYTARFVNGNLASDISSLHWPHNQGTQIEIYDLFYNLPTRRQFLLNEQREEFKEILSLIQAFSLNFFGKISFVLYRDSPLSSFKPPFFVSDKEYKELVCNIVKPLCFADLIMVNHSKNMQEDSIEIRGIISSQKHYSSEMAFFLFINNRLIEFKKLKGSLKKMYQNIYMAKNRLPFLFLSMDLSPLSIDVNFHPSKREILISNSEILIKNVHGIIESLINDNHTWGKQYSSLKIREFKNESTVISKAKLYNDPKLQTIDCFLSRNQSSIPAKRLSNTCEISCLEQNIVETPNSFQVTLTIFDSSTDCEFLKNSTYVGCLDNKRVLLQYGLCLYETDIIFLSSQYFYHILSKKLKNNGLEMREVNFELEDILNGSFEEIEIEPKTATTLILNEVIEILKLNSPLLYEFGFSFDWDNLLLKTIPNLIDTEIVPTKRSIGIVLSRISLDLSCKDRNDILNEIVFCYTFVSGISEKDVSLYFKHYLYPQLKIASVKAGGVSKKTILNCEYSKKILDIPTLFKFFERC
jgi:DNA mismatch repair protein MutL